MARVPYTRPLHNNENSRRAFLRFLAASPLAAAAFAQSNPTPADLLSVSDFEELTRNKLPPAHLGYLMTGVDDDLTLKANRDGFQKFALRTRKLIDVSKIDLSTQVFGQTWDSPIFLCPVGAQGAFHNDAELAVARAAKAKKHVQILSTVTSRSVEDVARELGTPPWYQLYMPTTWDSTEKMVKRVEAAGCPVLVWTVDLLAGRNTETGTRMQKLDTRTCANCHTAPQGSVAHRPMFQGLPADVAINPRNATWSYIERLKKMTKMKVMIKGIDSAGDARLCRESGADGIILSNHGGRATETLRSTIEALPEVVAEARNLPVLVDGGFRRGTDIFKALAMGAKGVGIGRPYIFGLTAFGQPGVERVLDILRAELTLTMRQCGAVSIRDIGPGSIQVRA
jgi:isopentenyl diphosphate isomerase/L-lactate dehydrogenase-like FMN-dependent dehydrogenase